MHVVEGQGAFVWAERIRVASGEVGGVSIVTPRWLGKREMDKEWRGIG